MPHKNTHLRTATALLAIASASLLLAACGGSSGGGSSSSANATAAGSTGSSTTTSPTPSSSSTAKTSAPPSAGKTTTAPASPTTPGSSTQVSPPNSNGKTNTPPAGTGKGSVPARGVVAALRECVQRNGATLPSAGAHGTLRFPSAGARAAYQAALKKCLPELRRLVRPAAPPKASGDLKLTVGRFIRCMRENGIDLPPPNVSGRGPVFDTKGIDTHGAKFKAASSKCRQYLPNLPG
jgi:hypothetical protein